MSDKKLSLRDRRRLLRAFRKQTGLTLVELGKLSGLSNPMLSQFENGNVNLSAEAASRLLAVIGESPVMTANLITRVSERAFNSVGLFETAIPPLRNVKQPERFVF